MQEHIVTLPDSELIADVRLGGANAEAVLYEKYSSRVYFLALSELHSKQDADDVRAETFLRVIQALRQDKLRKPESLPSFIIGIALNVVREHTRLNYKSQQLDGSELSLPGEHSLESAFLDAETSQAIKDTAAQLKPRERDFLRMYYFEELSKQEIAISLGIKEERLRLIKSRALKSFRQMYKKLKKD